MNKNVRIVRELIRIAKELTANDNQYLIVVYGKDDNGIYVACEKRMETKSFFTGDDVDTTKQKLEATKQELDAMSGMVEVACENIIGAIDHSDDTIGTKVTGNENKCFVRTPFIYDGLACIKELKFDKKIDKDTLKEVFKQWPSTSSYLVG